MIPDTKTRPEWIRGKVSWNRSFQEIHGLLEDLELNSVCVSASCPNKGECWSCGHVTFMILGDKCTRACRFCGIEKGKPDAPDPKEPERIASAVKKLRSKYVVITSVTRDDLPDKGADHFIETTARIKKNSPDALVELLVPDMGADEKLLGALAGSGADVLGHNIEMPASFYSAARAGSDYRTSLRALNILKKGPSKAPVKSSIILGLGEDGEDIIMTVKDLKEAGVDILYIGQYLSPSGSHWPVKRYYRPDEFDSIAAEAREVGFKTVLSGPMVRSSYRAYESYLGTCPDRSGR